MTQYLDTFHAQIIICNNITDLLLEKRTEQK